MCGLLDQQLHSPLHKVNKKRGHKNKYFIFQTLRFEAVHYVAFQLLQTSLTKSIIYINGNAIIRIADRYKLKVLHYFVCKALFRPNC